MAKRKPATARSATTTSMLPEFVAPMLAEAADAPFDSAAHLFEVKWDGFRSLARIAGSGQVQLLGRRRSDFTADFPELLPALRKLPPGTLLDGEIVAMVEGKPDFEALLSRSRSGRRSVAQATYIPFDLLYENSRPLLDVPLGDRRARLESIVSPVLGARLQLSMGVRGEGVEFFRQTQMLGLEGVMGKLLSSKYEPGKRSRAWLKIKPDRELVAVIIGFEPSEERGLRSLVVAAEIEKELKCVGQVGSGLDFATHARLLAQLLKLERRTPAVVCTIDRSEAKRFRWVEPVLFCRVGYLEMLKGGKLRGPTFRGLLKSSNQ